MAAYHLVSTWEFEVVADDVFRALQDYAAYPTWWPDMAEVWQIEPGGEDGVGGLVYFVVRSPVGYSLGFNIKLVESETPTRLFVEAWGDLTGTGGWRLDTLGAITTARYTWDVSTTKRWMNLFTPLARPVFSRAHASVMRRGARGLARHLGVRLVGAG